MKKSLDRFLIAQQNYYHDAYEELKVGKKRSHWMWFIFPQIRGLGYSNMAIYYAIESREEAETLFFLSSSALAVMMMTMI